MHSEAQAIARLRSMAFLVEEALRIADEGESAMLGAKLSDCIDCLNTELARIAGRSPARAEPGLVMLPAITGPLTVSL